MHRIVLAGSVTSSFATLKKLVEHNMNVVGVLGYEPNDHSLVSGYANMSDYCLHNNIPYTPFKKINSPATKQILTEWQPDIFFVVGLSQLVPEDMLTIARLGNIGFHPTTLPRGRGRAPVAWLILEESEGAANFFLMGEGADDGPIFMQKRFAVDQNDTAATIGEKIIMAINGALDEWLPQLKAGRWEPVPQDDSAATYYGKRGPEDGWINWTQPARDIDKLIRASTRPHPGAYTFINDRKISVFQSRIETGKKIKGVVGSVLLKNNREYLIQTGNGLLWIFDMLDENGNEVELKVGQRLGLYSELEIYKLKNEIKLIKQQLGI